MPQVFTLPKVSAKLKLKLTALEGSRVRRVSVAHFGSCRAEDYGEHHLAVLTNLGDIQVVSLPLLKPQVRYSCIRREDVSGIASCVFTKHGQGVRRRVPLRAPGGRAWGSRCAAGAAGKGSQGRVAKAGHFEGSPGPRAPGRKPRCQQPQALRGQSPPPGFYLISPSEFERFSLSTKWLVEPRCLVDSADTKHHDRPRNGSGPEKALGRARWVKGRRPWPQPLPLPLPLLMRPLGAATLPSPVSAAHPPGSGSLSPSVCPFLPCELAPWPGLGLPPRRPPLRAGPVSWPHGTRAESLAPPILTLFPPQELREPE